MANDVSFLNGIPTIYEKLQAETSNRTEIEFNLFVVSLDNHILAQKFT